ncbi:hypothetical protein J6590_016930 [Homalodisca vitripennis]|nr:hypothetical protein J6590_016930 [Homalodisca vitripennis]
MVMEGDSLLNNVCLNTGERICGGLRRVGIHDGIWHSGRRTVTASLRAMVGETLHRFQVSGLLRHRAYTKQKCKLLTTIETLSWAVVPSSLISTPSDTLALAGGRNMRSQLYK